ncbi:hypothetical protein BD626DRAFT_576437 [Schizophyllum amplum]|uniref:Uncharacterized protein n=1 Tax=Schizophyllum amplum TaxID=97359 RepID=A0A550BTJ4_9AGAR|nr:hypothetical protein BD626DRAFT_576437 [Auriculariopsis ampla]
MSHMRALSLARAKCLHQRELSASTGVSSAPRGLRAGALGSPIAADPTRERVPPLSTRTPSAAAPSLPVARSSGPEAPTLLQTVPRPIEHQNDVPSIDRDTQRCATNVNSALGTPNDSPAQLGDNRGGDAATTNTASARASPRWRL